MSGEVRVPALPESVTEATLVAWRKRPGESIRRDEPLVDIETDKVVFEVPSPEDGILEDVLRHEGDTVTGNELIGVIAPQTARPAATPAPALHVVPDPARPEPEPSEESAVDDAPDTKRTGPALGPAVRRMVAEHALDPGSIPATGKDGRLTKADVVRHLQPPEPPARATPAATPPASAVIAPLPLPQADTGTRPTRRVAMSRLRARIAERLVEAQHTAAILTTFNEINLRALQALRHRHAARFHERHGVKLGLMSFFVKASVDALRRFPIVNAAVEEDEILYHDYFDIGIAVASPRGLVVPVLRDADRLGFAAIEAGIARFSRSANEGSLSIEDLAGGTFTITNGGVFGSLLSTPILNPPQSAILGMHKIQDRPVVEDGEIRIAPMMYVALSYDHRIIDGRDAVQFLVTVKEALEDPARLLLEI